jgi:hypothetical protein
MKKVSLILAAVGFAAGTASADWMINDYATVTADSATTNTTYGIQTFENSASAVTVTVPGGYVSLNATKVASDPSTATAGDGYSANIGLLHPLTPDWSVHDLTGLTSITFDFQNSDKITDYFGISFGSTAYTTTDANAGHTFEVAIAGASMLAATTGTTWKTATVLVGDFATPKWWTPVPATFPTIADVLKKVKNLQFGPKTTYTGDGKQNGTACTGCTVPTMTKQTLKIRNITLVGVSDVSTPNKGMVGCDDLSSSILDNFADGDSKNEAGGYWYNFSDYDTTQLSTDKAKGSSVSKMTITAGDALNSGWATLSAQLKKKIGTVWHDYAGWAALGTGFQDAGTADLTGLTAIKFHIQADTLSSRVKYIGFKVSQQGVSDTATHFATVARADVLAAGGADVCIRPADLGQESFVTTAAPINVAKIQKLAWEAKISDNKSTTIDTAAVSFKVTDVVFYGVADGYPVTSAIKGRTIQGAFSANYAHGALSIKGFKDIQSFDVISLDGKKIASFAPQASVALSLPRGTYFLTGKRAGARVVQSFEVLGR